MNLKIFDSSVIPFLAMVVIVIALIVSLPYFLGRSLDEQTREIQRIENNIYNNETNQRQESINLFNFTLDNVTKQEKINEAKIDMILNQNHLLNNTK